MFKKHVCLGCAKSFGTKQGLSLHMTKVHGKKGAYKEEPQPINDLAEVPHEALLSSIQNNEDKIKALVEETDIMKAEIARRWTPKS